MLASVAVHVALGEVILTVLLIVFTTVAFTGRKGPRQINGSNADLDIEEPTTANPLNAAQNDASEETPKLRPLRSPSAELRRSAPAEAAPVAAARLPFLDNVKVFLTALVVLHHCACAFGACGEGSWYLIVKGGGGPRAFRLCVKTFVTWNQAYFMSLFFFVSACAEIKFRAPHAIDAVVSTQISAYFVPTSYAKGWPKFQANKRRRLLVPALAVLLLVSPLTTLVAGNLTYAPSPGVGWYLWWLLLFNVVYASFQSVNPPVDEALAEALTGADAPTAARGPRLLLSTVFRIGAGLGICGFALLPFLVLTKGSFASMPVSIGSVTCDFLMFYLGLQAKAGGWLERPLTEQVNPFVLLGFVIVEAVGIAVASLDVDKFGLALVLLAGMFCLDMSLLVLLVFQRWGNVETRATRFLARGAFGVYLLHPLVVTAATRVYLQLAGDGVNYPVGFGVVAVVSLVVVWPLAYSLAQLPGLKTIL